MGDKKRDPHTVSRELCLLPLYSDYIGYKPLIVDMKSFNDDDHVIAVFREDGHWGAVAKSNFTSLRFREPVYRSLRELIMSYFDFFFNIHGEKSLRSYSLPFDLTVYNNRNWATTDEDLEYIGDKIESLHHYPVVTARMIKKLYKASDTMMRAGLLGSKPEGLFKPRNRQSEFYTIYLIVFHLFTDQIAIGGRILICDYLQINYFYALKKCSEIWTYRVKVTKLSSNARKH